MSVIPLEMLPDAANLDPEFRIAARFWSTRLRLENERGQAIAGPMEALRQNVRVVKWGTVAIFVAATLTVAVDPLALERFLKQAPCSLVTTIV